MGGGNGRQGMMWKPQQGLSPRGRGNGTLYRHANEDNGLSPRGRGKQEGRLFRPNHLRSIPAWAGETGRESTPPPDCPVYPRVGGGNVLRGDGTFWLNGLSPRGRGKRSVAIHTASISGSIPAWAGETPSKPAASLVIGVYPRVGGGNGPPPFPAVGPVGLSPRGRGKHRLFQGHRTVDRSIPAWAGETDCRPVFVELYQVYPRVGGGNSFSTPQT